MQRLVEDDELRDNIAQAYESARDAFDRLSNGKSPDEGDLRRQEAAEGPQAGRRADPRRVRRPARGAEARSRRRRRASSARCCCSPSPRGLALALSEGLRKKVLDALFGAEEEFEYTSTTTSSGGAATGASATLHARLGLAAPGPTTVRRAPAGALRRLRPG